MLLRLVTYDYAAPIDAEQHDRQLATFVKGLLNRLQQQTDDRAGGLAERVDWRAAAHATVNRAYGDDEPDYSDVPAYATRTRSS